MGCHLAQLSLRILFDHFYFGYMFSYTLLGYYDRLGWRSNEYIY